MHYCLIYLSHYLFTLDEECYYNHFKYPLLCKINILLPFPASYCSIPNMNSNLLIPKTITYLSKWPALHFMYFKYFMYSIIGCNSFSYLSDGCLLPVFMLCFYSLTVLWLWIHIFKFIHFISRCLFRPCYIYTHRHTQYILL